MQTKQIKYRRSWKYNVIWSLYYMGNSICEDEH